MDKVGLPKGLIRYASEDEIEKGEKFKFTTRMKAYAAVLVLLVVGSSFLILNRSSVEGKFIKPAGSTYYVRTIVPSMYTIIPFLIKVMKTKLLPLK